MTDSRVRLPVSLNTVAHFHEPLSSVHSVSEAGDLFLCGFDSGTIRIVNTFNGVQQTELSGHSDTITKAIATHDLIISGSGDCSIRLWDKETGKFISLLPLEKKKGRVTYREKKQALDRVKNARKAFEEAPPDQKAVAEVNLQRAIQRFSLVGSATETQPDARRNVVSDSTQNGAHENRITDLTLVSALFEGAGTAYSDGPVPFSPSFSSSSTLLASTSMDNTVKLWSLDQANPTSSLIHTIQSAHNDSVTGAVSVSGSPYLITVGWDKAIRVWDLRTCNCVTTFTRAHSDFITSIILLPSFDPKTKPFVTKTRKYTDDSDSDDVFDESESDDDHVVYPTQKELEFNSDFFLYHSPMSLNGLVYFATSGWDNVIKVWSFNGYFIQPYVPRSDPHLLFTKFFASLFTSRTLSQFDVDSYSTEYPFKVTTVETASKPPTPHENQERKPSTSRESKSGETEGEDSNEEEESEEAPLPFTESLKYSVNDTEEDMKMNFQLYRLKNEAQDQSLKVHNISELKPSELQDMLIFFLHSETREEINEKRRTALKRKVFETIGRRREKEKTLQEERKKQDWAKMIEDLRKKQEGKKMHTYIPSTPQHRKRGFPGQAEIRTHKGKSKVPHWKQPPPFERDDFGEGVGMKEWLLDQSDELFGKNHVPTDEEVERMREDTILRRQFHQPSEEDEKERKMQRLLRREERKKKRLEAKLQKEAEELARIDEENLDTDPFPPLTEQSDRATQSDGDDLPMNSAPDRSTLKLNLKSGHSLPKASSGLKSRTTSPGPSQLDMLSDSSDWEEEEDLDEEDMEILTDLRTVNSNDQHLLSLYTSTVIMVDSEKEARHKVRMKGKETGILQNGLQGNDYLVTIDTQEMRNKYRKAIVGHLSPKSPKGAPKKEVTHSIHPLKTESGNHITFSSLMIHRGDRARLQFPNERKREKKSIYLDASKPQSSMPKDKHGLEAVRESFDGGNDTQQVNDIKSPGESEFRTQTLPSHTPPFPRRSSMDSVNSERALETEEDPPENENNETTALTPEQLPNKAETDLSERPEDHDKPSEVTVSDGEEGQSEHEEPTDNGEGEHAEHETVSEQVENEKDEVLPEREQVENEKDEALPEREQVENEKDEAPQEREQDSREPISQPDEEHSDKENPEQNDPIEQPDFSSDPDEHEGNIEVFELGSLMESDRGSHSSDRSFQNQNTVPFHPHKNVKRPSRLSLTELSRDVPVVAGQPSSRRTDRSGEGHFANLTTRTGTSTYMQSFVAPTMAEPLHHVRQSTYENYGAQLLREVIDTIPVSTLKYPIVPGCPDSVLEPFEFESDHLLSTKSLHSVMRDGHSSFITSITPYHNGNHILSTGKDGTISIWNIVTGERVFSSLLDLDSDKTPPKQFKSSRNASVANLLSRNATSTNLLSSPSVGSFSARDMVNQTQRVKEILSKVAPINSSSQIGTTTPYGAVVATEYDLITFR
ncbi:hypothetical protein BLNAU_13231 [Blattamonas nauphoetae]|uniref:Uncharacterized protein n=1 Tax=Blattamonas nauphoetae TaxID=2049346 RepID=A0ABQ9XHD4_9EUKA|nr:hypothetical protein BLNAU_13231 [Blattamonas nauphoetae]